MDLALIDSSKKELKISDWQSEQNLEQILDQLYSYYELNIDSSSNSSQSQLTSRLFKYLSHIQTFSIILNSERQINSLIDGMIFLQSMQDFSLTIKSSIIRFVNAGVNLGKALQGMRQLRKFTLIIETNNYLVNLFAELGQSIGCLTNLQFLKIHVDKSGVNEQKYYYSQISEGISQLCELNELSLKLNYYRKISFGLEDIIVSLKNKQKLQSLELLIKMRNEQQQLLTQFTDSVSLLTSLTDVALDIIKGKQDEIQIITDSFTKLKDLQKLKIAFNDQVNIENENQLLSSFHCCSLKTLDIDLKQHFYTNIVTNLAKSLNELPQLEHLLFKSETKYQIQEKYLENLLLTIQILPHLKSLHIDINASIKEAVLLDTLSSLPQLINLSLDLDDNYNDEKVTSDQQQVLSSLKLLKIKLKSSFREEKQIDCNFLKVFENLKNLKNLDLTISYANQISKTIYDQVIKKVNCLDNLEVLSLNLQILKSQKMALCLPKLKKVRVLNLEIQANECQISEPFLFLASCLQNFQDLKELRIQLNCESFPTKQDSEAIKQFGQALAQLKNLQKINIDFTQIDFDGVITISESLTQLTQLRSCNLRLSDSFDLAFISVILNNRYLLINDFQLKKNMHVQKISRNRQKEYYSNQQIEVLSTDDPCFEDLELIYSVNAEVKSDQTVNQLRGLCSGLQKFPNRIQRLNIQVFGNPGLEGTRDLGKCLSQLKIISELNLSFSSCKLSSEQVAKIFLSFKSLVNLKKLYFRALESEVGWERADVYAKAFKSLKSLTHLSLQVGYLLIYREDSSFLGDIVSNLVNLEYLDLHFSLDYSYHYGTYKSGNTFFGLNKLIKLTKLKHLSIKCSKGTQYHYKNSLFVFYELMETISQLNSLQVLKIKYEESNIQVSKIINALTQPQLSNLRSVCLQLFLSESQLKILIPQIQRKGKYLTQIFSKYI